MPAVRRPRTVFLTTLVLVAVVAPLAALGARTASDAGGGKLHRPAIADLLDRIPLGFEANQGQYAPDVHFVARAPGHTVLLTERGLVVSTPGNSGSAVG